MEELRRAEALLRATHADDVIARDDAASGVYPVAWLAERLGLTATEQQILWILIAHELCPSARALVRQLNTEPVADPTLDTVRRAVFGSAPNIDAWRELGPEGALRSLGLIEPIEGSGDIPEHRQVLRLARRVLALVHGERKLDSEVAKFARVEATAIELAMLETTAEAIRMIQEPIAEGNGLLILRGGVGTGRRSLLAAIARSQGLELLAIDARELSAERGHMARQLRQATRECRLFGLAPMLLHLDALVGTSETPDRLDLVSANLPALVLATTSLPLSRRWERPTSVVELPPLTGMQRAKLWSRALPDASLEDADFLATTYPLAPALIHEAGAAAMRMCGGVGMQQSHVEAGIRAVLDDRLAGIATRVDVTQKWSDLVLPDDQMTAVVELLARIRERRRVYEDWGFGSKVGKGLGVSALFSGPPGTGKTMCAGLIARDLGTGLFQVDLSKIVSKWIGETEKNLAALFDAAEAGHAVLLFDEADALFGKRTEVRSSNDRHANQQTNYLLQRIESFAGICILTSNHDSSIDEAFRRRLSVHIRFPIPEAAERTRLWEALVPAEAPFATDLRFDQLAETYAMSGGYIRNAMLRAAFLAADANVPIDMRHITVAAQLEYEGMGKIVPRR